MAMFRRSLADLVRGIRANKKDEHTFIMRAVQEIKDEVKMPNKAAKVVAIQKLTYLHMLGYDMTWAAFHIIEVMSQEGFGAKRIGYLAASQCFNENTEVIMLATNLLKRDITSVNEYETGVALNALANICTPDLAQDLAADTLALVTSSRPYVRKKATLVLYKIFLRFPQALRPSFPRLKEKLEDPDPAVVSSAVNVICELARKNPKNYLPLAPVFFKLLTTSNNNWMLIKIIKLMGALTPLEKRLAKKLVAPLTDIMNSTPAMSLLYECINTCTIGLSEFTNVIRLCIAKLRLFVEDADQNLKYLGLLALYNIMKTHPKAVLEHRDMVIYCLDDEDITIRQRALDLLTGMVTRRNLMEIISKLMDKLEEAEGTYRDDIVEKVVQICSQENYKYITDFEWYINVLIELTHIGRTAHGALIREQFMDVCIRVQVTRPYGVASMITLLKDPRMVGENPEAGGMCEVLYAAAYIIGEFGSSAKQPKMLLEYLLQPLAVFLPNHVQAVFVHNALKIASAAIARNPASAGDVLGVLRSRLPLFSHSAYLEVQERACLLLECVALMENTPSPEVLAQELVSVFADPLNPVAARAQKKVPVPAGVDLDAQISSPPPSDDEDDLYRRDDDEYGNDWGDEDKEAAREREKEWARPKLTREEKRRQREQRKMRQASNPYYLGDSPVVRAEFSDEEEYGAVETLTADMLDMDGPLPPMEVDGRRARRSAGGRGKRGRKNKAVVVLAADEMPEDARASDDEDAQPPADELSAIDLTADLKPDEMLKTKSYPMPGAAPEPPAAAPLAEEPRERRRKKRRRADGERGSRTRRDRGDGDRRRGDGRRRKRRGDEEPAEPATGGTANLLGLDEPTPGGGGGAGDLLGLGGASTPPPEAKKEMPSPSYSAVDSPIHSTGSESDVRRDAAAPAAAGPASGGETVHTAGRCRDFAITYSLRVNPSQPNKVLAVLELSNKNRSGETASNFHFRLKDSLNTKLCKSSGAGNPRPEGALAPRAKMVHSLLFEFDSFLKTQVVKGGFHFDLNGVPKKMRVELVIPSSTFIQPIDVTEDQFADMMRSKRRDLVGASGTIKVSDVRAAIAKLADTLHLKIVSVSDSVFMYGRSISGDAVFVLVKRREDGSTLKVDIKTQEGLLSETLIGEVKEAFAPKE